jgi:phospholipid/cholesterol/gamma-HCH transport system permease protein
MGSLSLQYRYHAPEQIDALEVMGVNSLNYLVFPKIIALLMYPILIGISMF